MALRHRLVLLATGTVAVVVLAAAVLCYLVIRAEMRSQVDAALTSQASAIQQVARRLPRPLPLPRGALPGPVEPGEGAGLVQLIGADGHVIARSSSKLSLVPTEHDRAVVRGAAGSSLRDRTVDGKHLRVLTVRVRNGGVQLARSLESADDTLARLRVALLLLWLVATGLTFLVSRLFARDLETSRRALAESVATQRQLVADASHELRTPVTSLRTNIEVLLEPVDLEEEDRQRLLEDVRDQTAQIGDLINDVIESARGDHPVGPSEDVRLDVVVEEAVAWARRHAATVTFELRAEPVVVHGARDRIGRAVANLLDNAAKHSPPGGVVEVTVRDGVLEVADRGPGVPDAEKPHVFDRFYSGAGHDAARAGYGLGLAIVKQTADAHGGEVEVDDAPGGGAVFRFRLPAEAPEAEDQAVSSAPRP